METSKNNMWRALRNLIVNKPVSGPDDTYPKGRAKYTRTEPNASFDRVAMDNERNKPDNNVRSYRPLAATDGELLEYC